MRKTHIPLLFASDVGPWIQNANVLQPHKMSLVADFEGIELYTSVEKSWKAL